MRAMSIDTLKNVFSFGRGLQRILGGRESDLSNLSFTEILEFYDVVVMKHCYPASDIVEDIGCPEPTSERQSLENYKSVYRLLKSLFSAHPETLFIIWTLPPRHKLFEPADGEKHANAARATEFSMWLQGDFLTEGGRSDNIRIWDIRQILMDPESNFLKHEYELSHRRSDSHPNRLANNTAGPLFARFLVECIEGYFGNRLTDEIEIIFLHHSTGRNIYYYPDMGVPSWIDEYNQANDRKFDISEIWYPAEGNMPVHYYRACFGFEGVQEAAVQVACCRGETLSSSQAEA